MSHFTYLLALGLAIGGSSAVFGQTEQTATVETLDTIRLQLIKCGPGPDIEFESEPVEEIVQPPNPNKIYEQFDVAKMPAFPGGEAAMQEYLRTNLQYPTVARENCIQGTVALSFIIEKDGSLSNIKILKNPGGGCGQEAVRLLESMPCWTPGENKAGEPVRVKFTLPVRFRLE
jgi:periplasmic protein TonB